MDVQLNTLYVITRGAVLRRDHLTVKVDVEKQTRLAVPIHQLESIAVFGSIHVTPAVMALCAERGISVVFLSESGRLLARVDAPCSGNVIVRREQYRRADDLEKRTALARNIVAGKLQNSRNVLMRAARESDSQDEGALLQGAAGRLGDAITALLEKTDVDSIRGHEGDGARVYFDHFNYMVRQQRHDFALQGRTRRPPLDRMNALLSFLYSLLLHDCVAALTAAGLDPSVGYLHVDRPGRPGLALDLQEEFRSLLADRLALSMVNRQQVRPDGFEIREGGAVLMSDATRRSVVSAWQQRKREEVTHPYLQQKTPVGRLPFLQARVLARCLRGDLPEYLPCILKN
jgi:CRISPR-associated protein Cas1